MTTKDILAFGWYGGKFSHLGFLLPLMDREADHFVDVFGGSAAVVMNAGPFPVETYNDLDGDVVNFFRVLRENEDALRRAINLTPYSREELRLAALREDGLSNLERARRFFVAAVQSRENRAQSASGCWSYSVKSSNAVPTWLSSCSRLGTVAERFRHIQIENRPALDVVQRYDSPGTMFYMDPPYLSQVREANSRRVYRHEMSEDEHRLLGEAALAAEGRVLISGYRNPLYDSLFHDWNRVDDAKRSSPSARRAGKGSHMRQESVWMNYDPAPAQMSIV